MSVVAWDGHTLAADRKGICGEHWISVQKIRKLPSGEVVAWTGNQDAGLLMAKWYENQEDDWPQSQADKDDWSRLIVAGVDRKVKFYERWPIAQPLERAAYYAWGSGAEVALGAMAAGACARRAVEIACMWCVSCSGGADDYTPGCDKVVEAP